MSTDYIGYLQQHMSQKELFTVAQALNSAYYPFLPNRQIWYLIEQLFPIEITRHLMDVNMDGCAHAIVNDMVECFYPGEKILKYHLANRYIQKPNEVSAFEIKIGDSRIDYARINGNSYAYEIKTGLDSLGKLAKQVMDYASCFEYVTVVVDRSHLTKTQKILPKFCGIHTYRLTEDGCKFNYEQKREKSPLVSKDSQLANLTTKELGQLLKKIGVSEIPQFRMERENLAREFASPRQTNTFFKSAMKARFQKRWTHLQNIFPEVLPIDIQAFFNTQAEPKWVYHNSSFIVNK